MCKEADEEKPQQHAKRHRVDISQTELPQTLPEPGKPPRPPQEVIPLPVHSTGLGGDPLEIGTLDELVDLELSEMSAK